MSDFVNYPLIRVNKHHPCPICGKPDWCVYREDGLVVCMRKISEREAKGGGWIHYLDGYKNNLAIEVIPYKDHNKAEPQVLHEVYSELLEALNLSYNHHKQIIEGRKIEDGLIHKHGYKTLPKEGRYKIAKGLVEKFGIEVMSTIPGFMVSDQGNGPYPTFAGQSGLLIPVKDVSNRIVGLQIRLDNPEKPKDKYRWFSSTNRDNGTNSGTPAHVAYPISRVDDKSIGWITEGPLKANISADHLGRIVIGVAGVANWQAGNVLKKLEELEMEEVVIAYDADGLTNPTVKHHGEALANACKEAGYKVYIATWPLEKGKGLDDLLMGGYKPEIKEWQEESAKTSTDKVEEEPEPKTESEPEPEFEPTDINWPQLHQDALYGLAGDIVQIIEPHTESDPAALLVQLITIFGNRIGRTPHFLVESDGHYANLFIILVGVSSKGRKGTSYGRVKKLIKDADPTFQSPPGGLVSGEGLIYHVRDAIYTTKKNSKTKELEEVCEDEGVEDKRLLVYESEFSAVLKVLKREGNTLSEILRQAWDSGDLNTLAKNTKTKATNAHISLIGHITKEELKRELDEVSYANGFGNRILWSFF
jgi:hypothetical protein